MLLMNAAQELHQAWQGASPAVAPASSGEAGRTRAAEFVGSPLGHRSKLA
jgi:hypothetical protein